MENGAAAMCSVCISAMHDERCVPCSNYHQFHRACLLEWATTLHTCPMCRQDFEEITVYNQNDEVIEKIKAPTPCKKKKKELGDVVFDLPYTNMACEVCHNLTDEGAMILCDICDLGFHTYCLQPPLTTIPRGRWECHRCRPGTSGSTARSNSLFTEELAIFDSIAEEYEESVDDDDEDEEDEEEAGDGLSDGELASSASSCDEQSGSQSDELVNFDDDDVLGDDLADIPSTSRSTLTMKTLMKAKSKRKLSSRRKKPRKKRKSSKRSDDPSKKKSCKRKHRSSKRRGSKRKSKHRKRVSSVDEATSSRNRIADVCGIDLKHSDKYKVVTKGSKDSASKPVSVQKLDVLGSTWVLPPDSDVDLHSSSTTVTTESVGVHSGKREPSAQQHKMLGSLTLLDEILANQSKVLAPANLLKINRDGSLEETSDYKKYLERRDMKRKKAENKKEEDKKRKDAKEKAVVEVKQCKPEPIKVEQNGNCGGKQAHAEQQKNKDHVLKEGKMLATSGITLNKRLSDKIKRSPPFENMAHSACIGTKDSSSSNEASSNNHQVKKSRWQPVGNNTSIASNGQMHSSNNKNSGQSASSSNNTFFDNSKFSSSIPPPPTLNQNLNHSGGNSKAIGHPFELLLQQHQFPLNNPLNFNLPGLPNNNLLQQLLSGNPLLGMPNLLNNSLMDSSSAMAALNGMGQQQPVPNFLELMNNAAGLLPPPTSSASSLLGHNQPLGLAPPPGSTNLSTVELIAQILGQQQQQVNPLFLRPNAPPPPVSQQQAINQSVLLAPPPPIPSSISMSQTNGAILHHNGLRRMPSNDVPPPPPPFPLESSNQAFPGKYGLADSPMDIEDDEDDDIDYDDEPSTAADLNGSSKRKSKKKDDRSANVKVADAAMKVALKPYFGKRLISKDEYKDIMKKGVSKLRNCENLKPEKVDRFVKQYVDAISRRRNK